MAATIDIPQSDHEGASASDSLNDKIAQLEHEIQRISNKLGNSGYVSKAPAAAIEKERIRLEKFEHNLSVLRKQQAK